MNLTQYATPQGLIIPQGMDEETWANDIHRPLILFKNKIGKFLKESREYGVTNYGIDVVANTEVQMELTLGITSDEKPKHPNAQDKSKGIVTLEGNSQAGIMWWRKVEPEIDTWDDDRLDRADSLLKVFTDQREYIRQIKAKRRAV